MRIVLRLCAQHGTCGIFWTRPRVVRCAAPKRTSNGAAVQTKQMQNHAHNEICCFLQPNCKAKIDQVKARVNNGLCQAAIICCDAAAAIINNFSTRPQVVRVLATTALMNYLQPQGGQPRHSWARRATTALMASCVSLLLYIVMCSRKLPQIANFEIGCCCCKKLGVIYNIHAYPADPSHMYLNYMCKKTPYFLPQ